jgi:hypothetical protein
LLTHQCHRSKRISATSGKRDHDDHRSGEETVRLSHECVDGGPVVSGPVGETRFRFDRLSLCSSIPAASTTGRPWTYGDRNRSTAAGSDLRHFDFQGGIPTAADFHRRSKQAEKFGGNSGGNAPALRTRLTDLPPSASAWHAPRRREISLQRSRSTRFENQAATRPRERSNSNSTTISGTGAARGLVHS